MSIVWSEEAKRLGLAQPEPSTATYDDLIAWAKWELRDIDGAVPLWFDAREGMLYVQVPATRKRDAENAVRSSPDRPMTVSVAFVTM